MIIPLVQHVSLDCAVLWSERLAAKYLDSVCNLARLFPSTQSPGPRPCEERQQQVQAFAELAHAIVKPAATALAGKRPESGVSMSSRAERQDYIYIHRIESSPASNQNTAQTTTSEPGPPPNSACAIFKLTPRFSAPTLLQTHLTCRRLCFCTRDL
jgi:hypothetical protein